MKTILLVTTNLHKIAEYREVFSKYAIRVNEILADPHTYVWPEDIFETFPDLIAIMSDTNNLHHPVTGEIITDLHTYRGPVVNMCELTVKTRDWGSQVYLGSVEGRVGDPDVTQKEVFGWDGHFIPFISRIRCMI